MSRIGKRPIKIPTGVKVEVKGSLVLVEGPKGKLEEKIPSTVKVTVEKDEITVKRIDDELKARSAHGTIRSVISNMIEGVNPVSYTHLTLPTN